VEVVGEIVKQIHAFSLATDLGLALRTSMIDPSLKAYLPEAVGKLGRYYSATSELVCAARHRACRLFESIEVAPFQIPMPASVKVTLESSRRDTAPLLLRGSSKLTATKVYLLEQECLLPMQSVLRPPRRLLCASDSQPALRPMDITRLGKHSGRPVRGVQSHFSAIERDHRW
jgi:hypothetical protein